VSSSQTAQHSVSPLIEIWVIEFGRTWWRCNWCCCTDRVVLAPRTSRTRWPKTKL